MKSTLFCANREPGMNPTGEVCPSIVRSPGAKKYHQLSLLITSYHPNIKIGAPIRTYPRLSAVIRAKIKISIPAGSQRDPTGVNGTENNLQVDLPPNDFVLSTPRNLSA